VDDVTQRKIDRRTLLKGAAAAAAIPLAAACIGGGTTTSSAAPAASGSGAAAKKLSGSLSIIQWAHFVPEFDTKYFDDWAKARVRGTAPTA